MGRIFQVKERAPGESGTGRMLCVRAAREKHWGLGVRKLPCRSLGKESACDAGDLGLIPGLGRSPGEGNGNPL